MTEHAKMMAAQSCLVEGRCMIVDTSIKGLVSGHSYGMAVTSTYHAAADLRVLRDRIPQEVRDWIPCHGKSGIGSHAAARHWMLTVKGGGGMVALLDKGT